MIKYIGSKRRLVPALEQICSGAGVASALDLFSGTTRVAQAFKRLGCHVTAVDLARYAHVFARTYIETDPTQIDVVELHDAIAELNALDGTQGYFTETFCISSRYIQPHNGERIDAIRNAIEERYAQSALYPLLLTSLIEAADRIDSTTGVQMAYLKAWAPRSFKNIELRAPQLIEGAGTAVRSEAMSFLEGCGGFDLAYFDPPYNQHRYECNYHVWETLVAWDAPEHYGVACKRTDLRMKVNRSAFNHRSSMPKALKHCIDNVDARLLAVSYNDESWVSIEELTAACSSRSSVEVLSFDSRRYVGAQIGIHNPDGAKIGKVARLRNTEYIVISGEAEAVRRATAWTQGASAAV